MTEVLNPKHTFTFQDTGITVEIKKLSPLLAIELSKDFPAPKPPMQEVDYGDGKKVKEPNPANPEYIQSLVDYNRDFEMKMRTLVMKRGVVLNLTSEQLAEVKELREFYKTEYDKELQGDDKLVYISHIAIGSDEDMNELVAAIMRRAQPTEEEKALAKASFPS